MKRVIIVLCLALLVCISSSSIVFAAGTFKVDDWSLADEINTQMAPKILAMKDSFDTPRELESNLTFDVSMPSPYSYTYNPTTTEFVVISDKLVAEQCLNGGNDIELQPNLIVKNAGSYTTITRQNIGTKFRFRTFLNLHSRNPFFDDIKIKLFWSRDSYFAMEFHVDSSFMKVEKLFIPRNSSRYKIQYNHIRDYMTTVDNVMFGRRVRDAAFSYSVVPQPDRGFGTGTAYSNLYNAVYRDLTLTSSRFTFSDFDSFFTSMITALSDPADISFTPHLRKGETLTCAADGFWGFENNFVFREATFTPDFHIAKSVTIDDNVIFKGQSISISPTLSGIIAPSAYLWAPGSRDISLSSTNRPTVTVTANNVGISNLSITVTEGGSFSDNANISVVDVSNLSPVTVNISEVKKESVSILLPALSTLRPRDFNVSVSGTNPAIADIVPYLDPVTHDWKLDVKGKGDGTKTSNVTISYTNPSGIVTSITKTITVTCVPPNITAGLISLFVDFKGNTINANSAFFGITASVTYSNIKYIAPDGRTSLGARITFTKCGEGRIQADVSSLLSGTVTVNVPVRIIEPSPDAYLITHYDTTRTKDISFNGPANKILSTSYNSKLVKIVGGFEQPIIPSDFSYTISEDFASPKLLLTIKSNKESSNKYYTLRLKSQYSNSNGLETTNNKSFKLTIFSGLDVE